MTGGHINREPLAELLRGRRRGQGRPQGLLAGFLRRVRPRRASKPVLETIRAVGQVQGLAGDRLSRHPDPERPDGPDPRDGPLGPRARPGPRCPSHFSRFQPMYLRQEPASDPGRRPSRRPGGRPSTKACSFVYVGNVPGHEAEDTLCPGCGGDGHRPDRLPRSIPSGSRRAAAKNAGRLSPASGPEVRLARPSSWAFWPPSFQIYLLREFAAEFSGNELTFGLVLGSWLLWGGLGSLVKPVPARRPTARRAWPGSTARPSSSSAPASFLLRFSAQAHGPPPGGDDRPRARPSASRSSCALFLSFPLGHALRPQRRPARRGRRRRSTSWNRPARRRPGLAVQFLLIPRLSNWQGAAVVGGGAAGLIARRP
ncbi:MAG: hypothetical protein MZU95_01920 [Desulfomicrobium escambiense]|nr:hypothetical protein [Desulfomicrobium escambiense]